VRNIGSITVNISSGYVLDMNGNLIMGGPLNEVMIKPGEVGRVIISSNQTLIRENMYLAKVVTRRGTESLYPFVVPP
jgi:hypothetical protein